MIHMLSGLIVASNNLKRQHFCLFSWIFGLPKQHLFRFQICIFVHKRISQFPNTEMDPLLDTLLKPVHDLKGMMSHFYSYSSLSSCFFKFTLESWAWEGSVKKALNGILQSFICVKHGLIIRCVLFTKIRLSQFHQEMDPTRDRCGKAPVAILLDLKRSSAFWLAPLEK